MNLEKAYLTLHKASGIEVGDKVKVIKTVRSYQENGWTNVNGCGISQSQRNTAVGTSGIVARDEGSAGFFINSPGENVNWPFYCLELIEKGTPPLEIAGHEVVFTDKGIKVGCEEISHEDLEKLFGRLHERK